MDRQIITRTAEHCKKCGSINGFVKTCGTRWGGTMGISWARCKRCGNRAQIRVVDTIQKMDIPVKCDLPVTSENVVLCAKAETTHNGSINDRGRIRSNKRGNSKAQLP